MLKRIADLHTHTLASGHAYGTIRENAQAAAEMGLKILGTSEHGPGIPGTCDPIYFVNLRCVPDELYGVKILRSSEINVLEGGKLSLPDRVIEYLDYAIAGIHPHCYTVLDAVSNTKNVSAACRQTGRCALSPIRMTTARRWIMSCCARAQGIMMWRWRSTTAP